jgi:hypothetical protein
MCRLNTLATAVTLIARIRVSAAAIDKDREDEILPTQRIYELVQGNHQGLGQWRHLLAAARVLDACRQSPYKFKKSYGGGFVWGLPIVSIL